MSPSPFGAYIRACRLASGRSLREVAKAVGVSFTYIAQVETGVRPSLVPERWPALAKAIHADPDVLAQLAVPEVERLRARVSELEAQVRMLSANAQRMVD